MEIKSKLSTPARLALLFYFGEKALDPITYQVINERTNLLHSALLINQKFLNSLVNGEEKEEEKEEEDPMIIIEESVSLCRSWRGIRIKPQNLSCKCISALILMSKVKNLFIFSMASELTRELVNGWLLVCRALEKSKTLKQLTIRMDIPSLPHNRFIAEQLPNKVTHFHTDSDICSVWDRKRLTLEFLSIFVQYGHVYFYRIFRIKTKSIVFYHDYIGGLWEIANCGPMLPNPTIETFKIRIKLAGCKYYDVEEIMDLNEFMPSYRGALECLYQVNPGMKLKLYDWNEFGKIQNVEQGIKKIEQLIQNTHLFIDLANEIGTKIKSIKLNPIFDLNKFEEEVNQSNEKLAKHFEFKSEKEELKGVIKYGDIKIKISMTRLKIPAYAEEIAE